MPYCVQCGTKVSNTTRFCTSCGVVTIHQNLIHTSNTQIDHSYQNTLTSQNRIVLVTLANNESKIFIYVAIIVTYFLLASGIWIHKNHQARIITSTSDKLSSMPPIAQKITKKALPVAIKNAALLSGRSLSKAHAKKTTSPQKKPFQVIPNYPSPSTEYFRPPFMLELLKQDHTIHEQEPVTLVTETLVDEKPNEVDEKSNGLLRQFITSITEHGGKLPCTDVERIMSHCY